SSSLTGRPWHALRTPLTIFSRLNGSVIPERFTTDRLAVSIVVNRRWHSGHCRRRRIEVPSSDVRESTTLESPCRQNGQCTGLPPHDRCVGPAARAIVAGRRVTR